MASRKQTKQVTFGMWLAGTRWGLKMTIGVIAGLTAVFVFFKLGAELGLDKWIVAHRGYVDEKIEITQTPLLGGITEIRTENANRRLSEIEKQLFDNELSKFKARGTPAEVALNAQAEKLKGERDKILRLLELISRSPTTNSR